MPKIVTPLTAKQVENIKPTVNNKTGKLVTQLPDGRGLYLKLFWNEKDNRGHSWRFDFTSPATGKGTTMVIGDLDKVTLAQARTRRDALRKLLDEGKCPMVTRKGHQEAEEVLAVHKERKAAGLPALGTFKAVALDYASRKYTEGSKVNDWSAVHNGKWGRILRLHAFPTIGAKHVKDLKPIDFLDIVQKLERADKMETASCVRRYCQQVMDHATLLQLSGEHNPVNVIKRHVKTDAIRAKFAAVTTAEDVGAILAKIFTLEQPLVRSALVMSAYTAQRPANVRGMRWDAINLDAAVWTIPAAEMKGTQEQKRKGPPHLVPLPKQAVALLRALKKDAEEDAVFVFPNAIRELRNVRPMGHGAAGCALERLGVSDDMTHHGFRAMFRTLAFKALRISPAVLESQLAHTVGHELEDGTVVADNLKNSYNRADYYQERIAAMQAWADYLGTLTTGNAKGLRQAA